MINVKHVTSSLKSVKSQVCNGKAASGYTPIAAELSPPLGLTSHHHDPATQPLIGSAPRVPAMKVR